LLAKIGSEWYFNRQCPAYWMITEEIEASGANTWIVDYNRTSFLPIDIEVLKGKEMPDNWIEFLLEG